MTKEDVAGVEKKVNRLEFLLEEMSRYVKSKVTRVLIEDIDEPIGSIEECNESLDYENEG